MAGIYEAPDGPDFFLTERAMAAAHNAGVVALDCNVELLQEALDHVERRSGKTLGAPLANTSFVLMYGATNPYDSDRHYFESDLGLPLAPSGQLGTERPDYVVRHDLVESGRHVFEVRPARWHGDVAPYVARMVMGPLPEDQAFNAGLGAWGRQLVDAFVLSDPKKHRIQEEVARQFPGAVVLRRSTDAQPARGA